MTNNPTRPGALDGLRVVEFGNLIAVPLAAAHLAALGAEVCKVEPTTGDAARAMRSLASPDIPAPYLLACNQGKESVAIDLKQREGVEVARALIAEADIVLENFREGVMDRLGLGAREMSARHPELIYVALRGFGPEGSEASRPGVDGIVQAASGMIDVSGDPDTPGMKAGYPVVDHAAAQLVISTVLAALLRRARTGTGEALTVTLFEAAMFMQATTFTDYLVTGEVPPRSGNGAPTNSPSDLLATSDGVIFISAYLDRHWDTLCEVLKMPELQTDPRFIDRPARVENRVVLKEVLDQVMQHMTTAEAEALLGGAGLMVAPVADYVTVAASDQVRANQMLGTSRGPDGVDYPALRSPFRVVGNPEAPTAVPAVGEHTRSTLRRLGYTDDQIEALAAAGIVSISEVHDLEASRASVP